MVSVLLESVPLATGVLITSFDAVFQMRDGMRFYEVPLALEGTMAFPSRASKWEY